MIRIGLDGDAVARSRFGISPLGEAVASIGVLKSRRVSPRLSLWAHRARTAVAGTDLELLFALVQPRGYTPDFLAPEPPLDGRFIATALADVAAATPQRIRAELAAAFAGGPLPDVVATALAQGESALAGQVSEQLGKYWRLALADVWPDLLARLAEDIRLRSHQLSTGGFAATVAGLHPGLRWTSGALEIDMHNILSVDGAEKVALTPSVFTDGRLLVGGDLPGGAPSVPLLIYPATFSSERLVPGGRESVSPGQGLADLLGDTRARLLLATTQPVSTTDLSGRCGLSAGAVSHHLVVLHRAGLLERMRDGRKVLYRNSAAGMQLLRAAGLATTVTAEPALG